MVDERGLVDAIRRHEERMARDPDSLAFAQLADLYRKAGRTGEAVATCREGLRRWPHYTTARLILAKTLLAEGQHEAALGEISAILQTSPKDVQCHRLAAEIHRRAGRSTPRWGTSEKAVGLDPGDRESTGAPLAAPGRRGRRREGAGLAPGVDATTRSSTLTFGTLCLEQGWPTRPRWSLPVSSDGSRTTPRRATGWRAALRARSRRRG